MMDRLVGRLGNWGVNAVSHRPAVVDNWLERLANWGETAFGGRVNKLAIFTEVITKKPMFGCQMCGQCALQYTGFVCSMQCPKNLRNGPCGGAADGHCEVYEDRKCVWVRIYDNSKMLNRLDKMERILPPNDWRLQNTSSWFNHFSHKDAHIHPVKVKDEPSPAASASEMAKE